MIDIQQQQKIPFKSVAVALLFGVFLGPIGLLYATVVGGIVMIALGFIVISSKLFVPIALVWVMSCVWGVSATNRYNQKLLQVLLERK